MAIVAQTQVKSLLEPWKGQVTTGQHQLITDKPESFGGHDQGPAPYDFLLAGLASCTMITLRMYAAHKEIDFGEFTVDTRFISTKEGESIERTLHFKTALSEEMQAKVLSICEKTPVTKTLLRSLTIQTTIVE